MEKSSRWTKKTTEEAGDEGSNRFKLVELDLPISSVVCSGMVARELVEDSCIGTRRDGWRMEEILGWGLLLALTKEKG